MFKLCIIAAIVGLIGAASDAEWTVYKATHGKVYGGETDALRRIIWEDNLKTIQRHNELYAKGLSSFYVGDNEYADMTPSEFVKTMNGYKGYKASNSSTTTHTRCYNTQDLPSEVNWVKKGYVTGVKNQGQCGSCWAFSSTGSLEGAHFKKTGKLVSLSESNLVDCTGPYGNAGCNGGWMDNSFKYVTANKGLDMEYYYPYRAQQSTCRYDPRYIGTTESSYTDVTTGSEEALKEASATVGPISVAIDASHRSFQLYRGGVYDEPSCGSTVRNLDHAVLVVGYGVYNGDDYWLVKNSWGTSWGLQGYIMMSRNKNNQCGIATKASYPVV